MLACTIFILSIHTIFFKFYLRRKLQIIVEYFSTELLSLVMRYVPIRSNIYNPYWFTLKNVVMIWGWTRWWWRCLFVYSRVVSHILRSILKIFAIQSTRDRRAKETKRKIKQWDQWPHNNHHHFYNMSLLI